jgi:tetratricopeptide (TPR) repeat protein
MTDNRIKVSSVSDSRIARYSSDSIQKSLDLAKKLSNPYLEQEEDTKYSDLNTLLETAQKNLDIDSTKLTEKILEGKFDFNDFLKQMQMLKNMGSLGGLLKAFPGIGELSETEIKQGEDQLERAEIMIASMMEEERADPDLIAGSVSRQQRVAEDSGYSESDIQKCIAEFKRMRSMMQQMSMGNISDADNEADIKSERDAEYYYDLGMKKYELKDYQSAIDDYTQTIKLDPDNISAYSFRADSKHKLEDYQGAIDDYTQTIKLDPNYAEAYYFRAVATYHSREYNYESINYQDVIADLTQSIKLDTHLPSSYFLRAIIKDKLGDHQGAIDDCTQTIKLDPNHSFALEKRDNIENELKEGGEELYSIKRMMMY